MPLIVNIILTILLLVVGALCIYGQVGLTYKEEKPERLRKVGVIASYFVMLAGLVFILGNFHSDDSYKEDIQKARQEGYDDGYNVGYDEGYNEGHESGLEEGWHIGYDDAALEFSDD